MPTVEQRCGTKREKGGEEEEGRMGEGGGTREKEGGGGNGEGVLDYTKSYTMQHIHTSSATGSHSFGN